MRDIYPDPNHQLPRPIMYGGAALMIATVVLCAGARATGVGVTTNPEPQAVVSRDLLFTEADDGVVEVRDAKDGHEVTRIAADEGGFIRATMRGLARNRTRYGEPADGAFRIALGRDGGVWLEDPSTRQNVDLRAFGPTQVKAFGQFLGDEAAR